MLEKQLGLKNKKHKLFYFGDIDYEGISIWNTLNEKRHIIPAVTFSSKLLEKLAAQGKENQKENAGALENFIDYFSNEEGNKIKMLLKQRYYYPQEGLRKDEIGEIWRKFDGI